MWGRWGLGGLSVICGLAALWGGDGGKVDYTRDVKPILEKYCYDCHGPKQQLSGLRLDRKQDVKEGGYSGQIIIPGDAEGSRIIRMIGGIDGMPMPIGEPKPARAEVDVIRRWIDQGAPWPDEH